GADQVVVLDRGYVVGTGPLPDLLRTCPEMRRLWREELVEEAEEGEGTTARPALPRGGGRRAERSGWRRTLFARPAPPARLGLHGRGGGPKLYRSSTRESP